MALERAMTAYELYKEARLDEAIEAALRKVKAAPTDVDARLLLCDLLCFANQLERADRQLDVLVQQDSSLTPGVGVYRQIIRAELSRREVFDSGRAPEFMGTPPEVLELHLRALIALREGAAREASESLGQAERLRVPLHGQCDDASFDDFRDVDDLTASFLEILASTGKYYWVAWDRLESLEFRPVKHLRDLLWRPAEMVVRGGPEALVYVPVLYPGSHRSEDGELRLGRKTDWVQMPDGPTVGRGQRTFLVGDADKSILSIQKIAFAPDGLAG
jgi:type VI secretion system protein ImpE